MQRKKQKVEGGQQVSFNVIKIVFIVALHGAIWNQSYPFAMQIGVPAHLVLTSTGPSKIPRPNADIFETDQGEVAPTC